MYKKYSILHHQLPEAQRGGMHDQVAYEIRTKLVSAEYDIFKDIGEDKRIIKMRQLLRSDKEATPSFIKFAKQADLYWSPHCIAKIIEFIYVSHSAFCKLHSIKGDQDETIAFELIDRSVHLKIFERIFCSTKDMCDEDYSFTCHLFTLSNFILPENLEIISQNINQVTHQQAIDKLADIHMYRTPKDKIICITQFCTMVLHSYEDKKNICADSFLSIVIYTLIKSKIQGLWANLLYIREFYKMYQMSGDMQYYYTTFEAAIHFIKSLNSKKLKISEEQYTNQYLIYSIREHKKLQEMDLLTKKKKKPDHSMSLIKTYLSGCQNIIQKQFKDMDIDDFYEIAKTLKQITEEVTCCHQEE